MTAPSSILPRVASVGGALAVAGAPWNSGNLLPAVGVGTGLPRRYLYALHLAFSGTVNTQRIGLTTSGGTIITETIFNIDTIAGQVYGPGFNLDLCGYFVPAGQNVQLFANVGTGGVVAFGLFFSDTAAGALSPARLGGLWG